MFNIDTFLDESRIIELMHTTAHSSWLVKNVDVSPTTFRTIIPTDLGLRIRVKITTPFFHFEIICSSVILILKILNQIKLFVLTLAI